METTFTIKLDHEGFFIARNVTVMSPPTRLTEEQLMELNVDVVYI